jgi:hypothetical protein
MGNINVEKDILLCSTCGETSRFSEIVDLEREAQEEDSSSRLLNTEPPKHLKVISDPTDMTGRISLIYRKFSPMAFFLIPFTCTWTGFSMTVIYDLQLSLFGLPFLVGSIVLVSVSLFCLFGKRVLTLERGNGKYFFGVGFIGIFKRFTYDRQTKVREGETSYTVGGGRHGGGSPLSELHLIHPDKSDKVRICAGMSEDALDYVAAVIKREAAKV